MKEKGPYYNLDFLRKMLSNDTEEVNRMIKIFLDTAPEILSKLNQGFNNKEMQQVYMYAHKLKSSIDIFKITELATVIREIEKNSKESINLDVIPHQIARVNEVFDKVLESIRKEIS